MDKPSPFPMSPPLFRDGYRLLAGWLIVGADTEAIREGVGQCKSQREALALIRDNMLVAKLKPERPIAESLEGKTRPSANILSRILYDASNGVVNTAVDGILIRGGRVPPHTIFAALNVVDHTGGLAEELMPRIEELPNKREVPPKKSPLNLHRKKKSPWPTGCYWKNSEA